MMNSSNIGIQDKKWTFFLIFKELPLSKNEAGEGSGAQGLWEMAEGTGVV